MATPMSRALAAAGLAPLLLAGCYVVPIAPDGRPVGHAALVAPVPPVVAAPIASVLTARLYPSNDAATRSGIVTGAVIDLHDGRGRFEIEIDGERLVGEATRLREDTRRGVASAFGTRGTSMQCDYTMTSARKGAGRCQLSTGARYQVHLGD